MNKIHDDEQRLIYQTCPSCNAAIECEAEECTFCECKLHQDQVAEWEFTQVEEPESKSNSLWVMLTVNLLISMLTIFSTPIEPGRGSKTYSHRNTVTAKDRELAAKLLMQRDKSVRAEISALINREEKPERMKIVSVTISGEQSYTLPYTKAVCKKRELDPLERFRVPSPKH